ncbi:MAG: quinone-dependent dihydroorotate dehydrogenase [Candidatus Woesearchaeota archaeon]|jgi:dihydroorotate dehydrogenase|nr:quinone-dependent dihydroorotate dehydrogenase [Candidatus Woesearchaeota archaeon]
MKKIYFFLRNKTGLFLYKYIFKPVFFLFDPEFVHDAAIFIGKFLGSNFITRGFVSLLFDYSDLKLKQRILGIDFRNPLGLAAGFDKDANIIPIISEVGFGFSEVGSITKNPYDGNEGKRLYRLKKSKSLIVNYGLKNKGADFIYSKLQGKKFEIPVGISIAKTNCKETVDKKIGILDYRYTLEKFRDFGDYFTINISCPNAYGGEPFTSPDSLADLLKGISKVKKVKPIFLKLPADISKKDLDVIIKISDKFDIDGFVATNLTKNRKNKKIIDSNVPKIGGISGKVVSDLTDDVIAYLYKKTKGEKIIIGCGGIFSAKDAYKKIRLGASLLQMITGMIYEGPSVISEINRGLVEMLEKDGFKNVSDAIGIDNKN